MLTCLGCANSMLLHPTTGPTDAGGAERRVIAKDGREIEIFIARSPGAQNGAEAKAFVLEFCGNSTRAEYIAPYVAGRWGDRPVEVWVMNYPGFGGTTGPATLAAIAPASLAAYDEMARVAGDKPIVISGYSLGTCAALYVAAQKRADAMILQNPPPLQRAIMQRHGWWNFGLLSGAFVAQIPRELDSLESAPKVKLPAVFVLAGKDQTVPPQFQQWVVDAYAGEKHLIRMPQAGHSTPIKGEFAEQFQKELDWIWARMSR